MRALQAFLQDAFRIRPEEAPRVGLAFIYLFMTIGAFVTARITRSVLFLEIPHYEEQLPLTYVGVAIAVSTVMALYSRVERKLRRDQTNRITLVVIIVVTLLVRYLLSLPAGPGLILKNSKYEVYWLFFIWVEIMGTLLIVQFWTFTNEIFHSRQAKRLFAVIGGGGVLANIFVGLGIRRTVRSLGTENLLFVICACLVVNFIIVTVLGKNARAELTVARDRGKTKSTGQGSSAPKAQKVFTMRHVQLIAAVIVLTYLVSTMVDYQFNVIVGQHIPLEDDRSAYFATFFLYTGIIGGIIQFFFTARLLERFGVLVALLLLPSFMLMGSVGILLAPVTLLPALWAGAFTKGSENCLRYTVNDSTLQLLYLPVPTQVRGRAKAVIDGILKPVSIGSAGMLMAVLVGRFAKYGITLGFTVDVYDLSWVVAGALVAWAVTLLALRREYLKSLVQTLQRRRLNFSDTTVRVADEGTLRTLQNALSSEDVGQALHALELLPTIPGKARAPLNDTVVGLLAHPAEEIRVAALAYLGSQQDALLGADVGGLLDDPSDDVRAAAVLAYCAVMHEAASDKVRDLLDDPNAHVRAAAVAGLIRYGGLDGVLESADVLKRLLGSDAPEERRQAAWVLGEVGVKNFYQPLVPLLDDDSERVREAAVVAAGRLSSAPLVDPLIEQLHRPRLCGAAVTALAAYGAEVQPALSALLDDVTRTPQMRAQACRVLARLGDASSTEALEKHLSDGDVHVRGAAAQALGSMVRRLPSVRLHRSVVHTALHAEAEHWFGLLTLELDLRLPSRAVLLKDALEHRRRLAQNQILALLALVYPTDTVDLVARNLQSSQAASRGNAVEVLDNLLRKEEKPALIPIFDDASADRTLQAGAAVFSLPRRSRNERLRELLAGPDAWLRICAALEVGEAGLGELAPEVRRLLGHPDPVCRETAIAVLRQLAAASHTDLAGDVKGLLDDPVTHVSRFAKFVLGELS